MVLICNDEINSTVIKAFTIKFQNPENSPTGDMFILQDSREIYFDIRLKKIRRNLVSLDSSSSIFYIIYDNVSYKSYFLKFTSIEFPDLPEKYYLYTET